LSEIDYDHESFPRTALAGFCNLLHNLFGMAFIANSYAISGGAVILIQNLGAPRASVGYTISFARNGESLNLRSDNMIRSALVGFTIFFIPPGSLLASLTQIANFRALSLPKRFLWSVVLSTPVAILVLVMFGRHRYPGVSNAVIYLCVVAFVLLFVAQGFSGHRFRAREWDARHASPLSPWPRWYLICCSPKSDIASLIHLRQPTGGTAYLRFNCVYFFSASNIDIC
jgi:hypothetical protein